MGRVRRHFNYSLCLCVGSGLFYPCANVAFIVGAPITARARIVGGVDDVLAGTVVWALAALGALFVNLAFCCFFLCTPPRQQQQQSEGSPFSTSFASSCRRRCSCCGFGYASGGHKSPAVGALLASSLAGSFDGNDPLLSPDCVGDFGDSPAVGPQAHSAPKSSPARRDSHHASHAGALLDLPDDVDDEGPGSHEGGEDGTGAAGQGGFTARNVARAALMALLWYGGSAIYGCGASLMGPVLGPVIVWTCATVGVMLTANVCGVVTGEWSNAAADAKRNMAAGVLMLVVAIVLMGLIPRNPQALHGL